MEGWLLVLLALVAAVQGSEITCAGCEYVILELEHAAVDPDVMAKVTGYVDEHVCVYLTSELEENCKALVDKYGPILLQLVIAQLTPENVCAAIHLCNHSVIWPHHHDRPPNNSTECDICEYVVSEMAALATNPSSLQVIIGYISELCKALPTPTSQTECKSILHDYGPGIIEMFIRHYSPVDLCMDMMLC